MGICNINSKFIQADAPKEGGALPIHTYVFRNSIPPLATPLYLALSPDLKPVFKLLDGHLLIKQHLPASRLLAVILRLLFSKRRLYLTLYLVSIERREGDLAEAALASLWVPTSPSAFLFASICPSYLLFSLSANSDFLS